MAYGKKKSGFKMKGYSGYTESPMKKKTDPKKTKKSIPKSHKEAMTQARKTGVYQMSTGSQMEAPKRTALKPLPHLPKVEYKKIEKKVVPEKYKKKKKI